MERILIDLLILACVFDFLAAYLWHRGFVRAFESSIDGVKKPVQRAEAPKTVQRALACEHICPDCGTGWRCGVDACERDFVASCAACRMKRDRYDAQFSDLDRAFLLSLHVSVAGEKVRGADGFKKGG